MAGRPLPCLVIVGSRCKVASSHQLQELPSLQEELSQPINLHLLPATASASNDVTEFTFSEILGFWLSSCSRPPNTFLIFSFHKHQRHICQNYHQLDRSISEYHQHLKFREASYTPNMKFFSQLLLLGLAAESTVASNWFSKAGTF